MLRALCMPLRSTSVTSMAQSFVEKNSNCTLLEQTQVIDARDDGVPKKKIMRVLHARVQ